MSATGTNHESTNVRMIATDLDGTLLREDGTVSDRTRRALQTATEAGLLVTFVTGRPPRWLHEVVERTGHGGAAVAANGAVLYDLDDDSVIEQHLLQPWQLTDLTTILLSAFPDTRFGVEYGEHFGHEPGYLHHWDITPAPDHNGRRFAETLVAPLVEVIAMPGVKLLAKDRSVDPDEFMRIGSAAVGDRASVTHSSNFGLLEIAVPGVTKASGLASIAAAHGIGPEEVVAVGDMPNDVPMLAWAGRAYAVRNAHAAVLELADDVLPSNDEDAVAVLIESVLAGLPTH